MEADIPAGRVAAPASARWAKWPDAAVANGTGASVARGEESCAAKGSVSAPASGLARSFRHGGGHRGLYCRHSPECLLLMQSLVVAHSLEFSASCPLRVRPFVRESFCTCAMLS